MDTQFKKIDGSRDRFYSDNDNSDDVNVSKMDQKVSKIFDASGIGK